MSINNKSILEVISTILKRYGLDFELKLSELYSTDGVRLILHKTIDFERIKLCDHDNSRIIQCISDELKPTLEAIENSTYMENKIRAVNEDLENLSEENEELKDRLKKLEKYEHYFKLEKALRHNEEVGNED